MPPSLKRSATRELIKADPRALILDGMPALLCLLMELGILVAATEIPTASSVPVVLPCVLSFAEAAALLVRRHRPLLSTAAALTTDVLLIGGLSAPHAGFCSAVALYSCGAYLPGRRSWPAGGAVALVAFGTMLILQFDGSARSVTASGTIVVPIALILVVGQMARLRRELHARRRAEGEREAVRRERRRIARELHDVVAHHITVMNVLVGGARATLDSDPESARQALVTAERTARQAMAEMRYLLDVLRADDSPDGPYVGAAQLPELIERSGLSIELDVSGAPRELPAAIDLTVYRIVQEALTNIRKHAEGARGTVRLRYEPGAVEVEVTDDGPGPVKTGSSHVPGHGLRGMAERVALCEGVFHAGALPHGGFRVFARLPVQDLPVEEM